MALNTKTSIVDYLKSVGKDTSFSNRSSLASSAGISGYTGSSSQNQQLLQFLSGGGGSNPSPSSSVVNNDDPNRYTSGRTAEEQAIYEANNPLAGGARGYGFDSTPESDALSEEALGFGVPRSEFGDFASDPNYRIPTLSTGESAGLASDYGLLGIGDANRFAGLTRAEAQAKAQAEKDALSGKVSQNTSFSWNSDFLSPTKKAFDTFNLGLKDAMSPWNTEQDKNNKKENLYENTAGSFAQLFKTPDQFDTAYTGNSEFKKLMDSFQKAGGNIDRVKELIAKNTPTPTVTKPNQLRVETDNKMLKDYAESTNQQIADQYAIPEQYREYYFGEKGYFTKIREDAEANLKALDESYKTIETNTQADYEANVKKAELQAEQQLAEIEEARVDAKNYMTGMLAKLGALKTTGGAPMALSRLETKYQTMANNTKNALFTAKSNLASEKAKIIANLNSEKLGKMSSIRQDVTKSSYEVQKELINLENSTKQTIGALIKDFNKESLDLDKKALEEANKLKLEYQKQFYKTASGGSGSSYGSINGGVAGVSQRAQDIINAINAGSGTIDDYIKGTSKEANNLRAEVLRGMSSTSGYSKVKIDQMTNLRDLAKDLETADVKDAVGFSWSKAMPFDQTLMSKGLQPKRASQLAKINNLKAQLTGENLGLLKGAMSDKDIIFLEQMANRINLDADEATFSAEMKRIREFMDNKIKTATSQNKSSIESVTGGSSSRADSLRSKYNY